MNKLIFTLLLGFFIGGCTQVVYLKKSPSEIVLTSIKSDNQKKYSYSFSSNVPDSLVIGNFAFDVNATYISNLKIFMNTKYTVVDKDSNQIDFLLISCTQTIKNANSGMQNTANVLNALGGSGNSTYYNNVLLTTEINLKVTVKRNGAQLYDKSIFTTDEYNGQNNDISSAQNSFDQAIGKSIIMIDKFLSSIE